MVEDDVNEYTIEVLIFRIPIWCDDHSRLLLLL